MSSPDPGLFGGSAEVDRSGEVSARVYPGRIRAGVAESRESRHTCRCWLANI